MPTGPQTGPRGHGAALSRWVVASGGLRAADAGRNASSRALPTVVALA